MSRGSGQDRDLAECYISVDVETGGATPADYALLSIGACLVDDPETTFYVELKPEDKRSTQEALEVSKLSLDILATMGEPPAEAMQLADVRMYAQKESRRAAPGPLMRVANFSTRTRS